MNVDNTDNIFKLPVNYHREGNVVTHAFVDELFLPYAAKFKWYLADVKVKKPPKTQLRVNGTPKSFTLNRLVHALSLMNDVEREVITRRENLDKLLDLMTLQPRFRAKNNDPFDCRIDNIVPIAVREVDPEILKRHVEEDNGTLSNAIEAAKTDELRQRFADHHDKTREALTEVERKKHEVPDEVTIVAPLPGSGLVPKELSTEASEQTVQDILNFLPDRK